MIRQVVLALVAGALFGAGLAVSGMADPERVRGFLDLFGDWDPTLAFVMGGALLPMVIAWQIHNRIKAPLAAEFFSVPNGKKIDRELLSGAALFGVGWGIAGLCPGPAIADLAISPVPASIFIGAMLVGMTIHRFLPEKKEPSPI
jgi:uncharacterized protein